MKKNTVAASILALGIGCGFLFAQQTPSRPAPPPAYSLQPFVVANSLGVSITDSAKGKAYMYWTDKDGKTLDLAGEIDLTKAGEKQIDWVPTPQPASGG